jgi:hypothetical protein
MNIIIVKISPKRWIIAQKEKFAEISYRAITRPIKSYNTACLILDELVNKDVNDYSDVTKEYLLDA